MENGIHHILMHYTHSLTDPVVSIAMYRKMQSFDPHFLCLNGIIRTILVAFSITMSRVCTGMLSFESDDFKFLKIKKKLKKARASRTP